MSDDPGRDLLMQAVAAGLMTEAQAEELDVWAGKLATEKLAGRMSEHALQSAIMARLMFDLARRGTA